MKILIVEDEIDIADPLKKILEGRGFAVDIAEDGKIGLSSSEMNDYDCILLDLNLPEIDGIEVAEQLRKIKNTPIIMVTARSQIENKLEGFSKGADDYVTKPFNIEELVARIKAVIKRKSENKSEKLLCGKFQLIPEQNCAVKFDGDGAEIEKVSLTTKETGILEYLIRNKSRIVSSEELLEHVWNDEVNLFSETIKTHMKTLRIKIDPGKKLIKTIRGKGYIID